MVGFFVALIFNLVIRRVPNESGKSCFFSTAFINTCPFFKESETEEIGCEPVSNSLYFYLLKTKKTGASIFHP